MSEPLFNTDNLVAVLEDLARDVRKGYGDSLRLNRHIASTKLVGTLSTTLEVRGTTYIVWLNLEDYWKYVEYDTRPHWAPIEPLKEWVRNKIRIGFLLPRPKAGGKLPKPERVVDSIAYATRWKIHNEGTTGTHDLQKTKDAILPMYEERLLEALQRDTLDYIEKVLP